MLSAIGTELLAMRAGEISAGRIWTGWAISGLTAAFMLFDAAAKFAKPAQVVEAFARTGWPMRLSSTLGSILLTCTGFYLVPQTSVLGAILLTGYLGGAVATNLRLEPPS